MERVVAVIGSVTHLEKLEAENCSLRARVEELLENFEYRIKLEAQLAALQTELALAQKKIRSFELAWDEMRAAMVCKL
jgi:cell shape-determining protein MreC